MLVVVQHRNVKQLAQALFNVETFGSFDVLKVYAAERGSECLYGVDDSFGLFVIYLNIEGINVGICLEQHGLTLHHWL